MIDDIEAVDIIWEIDKDGYYCSIEGQFPKILSKNDFCKEINNTISELLQEKFSSHKELCEKSSDLFETINDPEHNMSLSFQGAINQKFVSINLCVNTKSLGAAYRHHENHYFNYDLEDRKSIPITNFLVIDNVFYKLVLEDIKLESDYSEQDSIVVKSYLSDLNRIQYYINQNNLEIALSELEGEVSFDCRNLKVSLLIDDIIDQLKIPREELPTAVLR